MRVSCFPSSLSFSFYSLYLFPQKIEIIEQDPKTRTYFPIKMRIYIEDHNYTKISTNSQKKHLFDKSKAVEVNVWGMLSQTPITGPPELQISLVSCCHFRFFRATDSLREDVFPPCHFTFSVPNIYCGFQ